MESLRDLHDGSGRVLSNAFLIAVLTNSLMEGRSKSSNPRVNIGFTRQG